MRVIAGRNVRLAPFWDTILFNLSLNTSENASISLVLFQRCVENGTGGELKDASVAIFYEP